MTTVSASATAVPAAEELAGLARTALRQCGADPGDLPGTDRITASSPLTGEALFDVPASTPADVEAAIQAAHAAFLTWRAVPAPVRGGLVKRLGELLAEHQADLADLISIEVGKIRSELTSRQVSPSASPRRRPSTTMST